MRGLGASGRIGRVRHVFIRIRGDGLEPSAKDGGDCTGIIPNRNRGHRWSQKQMKANLINGNRLKSSGRIIILSAAMLIGPLASNGDTIYVSDVRNRTIERFTSGGTGSVLLDTSPS